MTRRRAFARGIKSEYMGQSRESNPFVAPGLRKAWDNGWRGARMARRANAAVTEALRREARQE